MDLSPTQTLSDDEEQPAAVVSMGRLHPTSNGVISQPVDLTDGLTIGRGTANNVQTKGVKRVSVKHVSFKLLEGAVFITDHSTNGTSVNSHRLQKGAPAQLVGGDEVSLAGEVSFIFQPAQRSAAPAAAAQAAAPSAATAAPVAAAGDDPAAAARDDADDELGKHLECAVCQEILYKCVSGMPCLHNLCAACWSECRKNSNECPICRTEVTKLSRNHAIANMVEAFLKKNPSKRRSAEELAEMDAKCTIDDASLRVAGKRQRTNDHSDDDESDDDESDDYGEGYDDSDSGGSGDSEFGNFGMRGYPIDMTNNLQVPERMRRCPNCPLGTAGAAAAAATPPDGFVCTAAPPFAANAPTHQLFGNIGPYHIRCSVCQGLIPKRAAPPVPTRCQFCARTLCDAYRRSAECVPTPDTGCSTGALGRLRPVCEQPGATVDSVLGRCFRGNVHEQRILKEYLTASGITVEALLADIQDKLRTDVFKLPATPAPVTQMAGHLSQFPWSTVGPGGAGGCMDWTTQARGGLGRAAAPPESGSGAGLPGSAGGEAAAAAHCCLQCSNKLLPLLVYQYRAALPATALPSAVTSRSDCWYGHTCRTQTNPHNPQHSIRLNHICEPRAQIGAGRGGRGGGGRGSVSRGGGSRVVGSLPAPNVV